MNEQDTREMNAGLGIAIVGMAGRFPGAENLGAFWRNLRDGAEMITFFTDEELMSFGVPRESLLEPAFVKAGSVLKSIDLFDAAFFGYSPREAEILDPQHRIFLECAWEALEVSSYCPDRYQGVIGVYAGASLSTYLLFNVLGSTDGPQDGFQAMIGNDKGFLSTRVSYEMNLTGPSIDVQTACSTSLVAVHLACQGLLSYQCDMALAGGVSVQVPQRTGYFYQPGGINSPDGHCRAFDARAAGTVFGSGVGVVALKRLADAIADNDAIHAVIMGSAVNNDGSAKIGYTAPSVEGQAQVIALAQSVAGVEPATIGYVEAHGTGTALGDPVEVTALTKAFRVGTDAKGYCALGSVKTNIGHLDSAAGVAGLIKAVLALKHRLIPPSLHFEQANPRIDFAGSPFYVNSSPKEWPAGPTPRRAGVSCFGIGGTNAHVILEEAPQSLESDAPGQWQLLCLSAKTSAALEKATANLREYIDQQANLNLADAAYSLHVGRTAFNYRRAAVCQDPDDAKEVLESLDAQRVFSSYHKPGEHPVVFMFPGGGAQHLNMGADLYRHEPVFRRHMDECAELLLRHLGEDLGEALYPSITSLDSSAESRAMRMKQPALGLPTLFAVEYSLAKLYAEWGIRPQAMIGHSLGEYTAACLAGVFSLEDAFALVCLRGRLFERMPRGAMLSVPLAEREISWMVDDRLSLAAINGPAQCVVSGPIDAVDALVEKLAAQEIEFRHLQIDVAAHSHMVEPILDEFTAFIARLGLQRPLIPFISNVTGAWITPEEATSPDYWRRHLRQTVRFAEGLRQLAEDPERILLEVGPGQTLTTLAKMQYRSAPALSVFASMRHPYDSQSDQSVLLLALGKLWSSGVQIDWDNFYSGQRRRRVALPTYPFERQRYWIEPSAAPSDRGVPRHAGKKAEIDNWFYLPSWKRTLPPQRNAATQDGCLWMIFEDDCGVGDVLADRLVSQGAEVIRLRLGKQFERATHDVYHICPDNRGDYVRVFAELIAAGKSIHGILHLWNLDANDAFESVEERFNRAQERGFYSLLFLAQSVIEVGFNAPLKIWIIADGAQDVEEQRRVRPEQSMLLAACKVIPQEFEEIAVSLIDVKAPKPQTPGAIQIAEQILAEINAGPNDAVIAYRGGNRWAQTYQPVRLGRGTAAGELQRPHSIYMITGGLGGVGLMLAEHLARACQARMALVQRSPFPQRDDWESWLATHDEVDEISRKIRRLQAIECLGAEVMVARADVADKEQMRLVMAQTLERFGALDCVLHAAGIAGEQAVKLIDSVELADCQTQFRAKVQGLYALEEVLREHPPRACLLFSSNSAVLGGLGSLAYTAANLFMDSFAQTHEGCDGPKWISVNWDGWLLDNQSRLTESFQTSLDQYAMTPDESLEAFDRVLATSGVSRVIVSTGDLEERVNLWLKPRSAGQTDISTGTSAAQTLHPRPLLGVALVPAQTELERKIAEIWQTLLGVEQLGIHDNFFDLGGNSLISLKVIARLKKELKIDIPVAAIFEGPTVSVLAKIISQKDSEKAAYEESRARGEKRRERRKPNPQAVEIA